MAKLPDWIGVVVLICGVGGKVVDYARAENFASPERMARGSRIAYSSPTNPALNQWGLGGSWNAGAENGTLASAPGDEHGPDSNADGAGEIRQPRMYQLIWQKGSINDVKFEIESLDPGV